jgi:hypothetical protein
MFSSSRYVVVDDEVTELRGLVDTLSELGVPATGVHFRGEIPDGRYFEGVRVLFSDLHLIPQAPARAQFAVIASMLEEKIDPARSGPYVLVLWTKHPDELAALTDYLETAVSAARKPLAVMGLDKTKYLSLQGEPNVAELKEAIIEQVSCNPQLRALLEWESDVLAAAAATLAEVGELVPHGSRSTADYGRELDGVLSRLAVASAGRLNVADHERAAVNGALAPILLDRVMNANPSAAAAATWARAVTRCADLPELDDAQVGKMNRMMHLAFPPAENIGSRDWGAVVALPPEEQTDPKMLERFGLRFAELMNQIFRIERADRPRCQLVLVRTGAICDYAQRKPGPAPYVLGLIVPISVQRRDAPDQKSEHESPILLTSTDHEAEPARLFVNARFEITMASAPQWPVLFRVREQMLAGIAAHTAEYVTRPGIVKLPH